MQIVFIYVILGFADNNVPFLAHNILYNYDESMMKAYSFTINNGVVVLTFTKILSVFLYFSPVIKFT